MLLQPKEINSFIEIEFMLKIKYNKTSAKNRVKMNRIDINTSIIEL